MVRANLFGGGGRSTASLYHTRIQIHALPIRGVSDARKDSTADPALADRLRLYPWSAALIERPRDEELCWYLCRLASILVSIRI